MATACSSVYQWISGLWIPSSRQKLEDAEWKILQRIKTPWEGQFVQVDDAIQMWTLKVNSEASMTNPPLVLVHGFISGVCWWADNVDALSEGRTVFAFDLPGFGRSSRPDFPNDAAEVEQKYITYIEEWRKAMGLESFVLLGHSLGGYLATAYALKHPERVEQLVLSDPWGFPILPYGLVERHPLAPHDSNNLPLWFHFGNYLFNSFNFLSPMRAFGPLGPWVTRLARYDKNKCTSRLWHESTILDYIYHCNAQNPTGENAFRQINLWLGWAKNPMIKRVQGLHPDLPIAIMYGSGTFLDHRTAYELKCMRPASRVDVYIVKSAGHDIHVDNAAEFNRIMRVILGCSKDSTNGDGEESGWINVEQPEQSQSEKEIGCAVARL